MLILSRDRKLLHPEEGLRKGFLLGTNVGTGSGLFVGGGDVLTCLGGDVLACLGGDVLACLSGDVDPIGETEGGGTGGLGGNESADILEEELHSFLARFAACLTEVLLLGKVFNVDVALGNSGTSDMLFKSIPFAFNTSDKLSSLAFEGGSSSEAFVTSGVTMLLEVSPSSLSIAEGTAFFLCRSL